MTSCSKTNRQRDLSDWLFRLLRLSRVAITPMFAWLLIFAAESACGQESPAELGNDLPTWVTEGSYSTDEANYVLVTTDAEDRWARHYQAFEAVDDAIRERVATEVDELLGVGASKAIHVNEMTQLEKLVHANRRIARKYTLNFDEQHAARYGTDHDDFFHGYAQLKFDQKFRDRVHQLWIETRLRVRLVHVAATLGTVFAVLAGAYGLLLTNHRTRGFYARRLKTAALIAGACLLIAGVVIDRLLVWRL